MLIGLKIIAITGTEMRSGRLGSLSRDNNRHLSKMLRAVSIRIIAAGIIFR